jgi:O-antigen ligase
MNTNSKLIPIALISIVVLLGMIVSVQMSQQSELPLTLLALLAIPAIIIFIKYPWTAIAIFFMLIPLENLYVYRGSLTASTTKLFGALLFALLITSGSFKYINETFTNKKGIWVLLFGGVAVLSILVSHDVRLGMSSLITLWLSIILYFILIMMMRNTRTLHLATIGLIIGGVLSILSPIVFGMGSLVDEKRYGGLWGDQNEFAAMLLVLIPLSVALFYTTKKGFVKLLLLGCSIMLIVGLSLTYSRGGYLAFGVMIVLAMFKFITGKNRAKILAITVPCLIFGSVIFYHFFGEEFLTRMETLRHLESRESLRGEGSLNMRFHYYFELAPRIFAEDPIFGVGLRGFILHNPRNQISHNTYIEVLTGMGLVGFIPFLIILYMTWRETRKVEKYAKMEGNENYLWAYAHALELGLISYFLAGMFISLDLSKMTWLLITLSAIIFNISKIHFLVDNQQRAASRSSYPWAEYGMPGQRSYGAHSR